MGLQGRTLHVRLTPELTRQFEALHAEYAGLPAGMVVKILLADQLCKPLSEQVEIIQGQIKGGSPNTKAIRTTGAKRINRIGLNANKEGRDHSEI